MSIKPALGWLALFLFATSAQAEGARDLLALGTSGSTTKAMPVTRKTKAAPVEAALMRVSNVSSVSSVSRTVSPSLVVAEASGKPRADVDAEGAVTMVFEKQRRASFHVARDHVRRIVRLEASDAKRTGQRDHVDVIDADEGIVVIDTAVRADGTTSDVYAFPRGTTLEQRIGTLAREPGAPARIREALVAAEWAKVPAADR